MFTSIDKALVALVMAILFIATQFGVTVPSWANEQTVSAFIAALTPILVWIVPNKTAAGGAGLRALAPFAVLALAGGMLMAGAHPAQAATLMPQHGAALGMGVRGMEALGMGATLIIMLALIGYVAFGSTVRRATALIAMAIFAAALAPLGGCAKLEAGWNAVTSAKVTTTQVVVLGNTFDALEATATNYLSLPKCTGANGPICANATAVAKIIPAVRAGRVARDNLEAFAAAHPDQLGTSGLYDAFKAAVTTLQGIYQQYAIGG